MLSNPEKGAGANLQGITKVLMNNWERTRNCWRDQKAAEFAENYLNHLPDRVTAARKVMEELEIVLAKIRKDCS